MNKSIWKGSKYLELAEEQVEQHQEATSETFQETLKVKCKNCNNNY